MAGTRGRKAATPTLVVAMDKFKGTATADQACSLVSEGIAQQLPDWACVAIPMADGGDGTVEALIRAGWQAVLVDAIDAQSQPVSARVATRGDTAVVELADVCGIARWQGELRPWQAHTLGLGMVLRSMVDEGVRHIVVALGGSASTDGGSGVLAGLGFEVLDDRGDAVEPGLAGLQFAHRIRTPADIELLRQVEWTVLVDVDAPLFGPRGAARSFGPQKGMDGDDVEEADLLLRRWDDVLRDFAGCNVGSMPGTGAAGGVAAAIVAALDADMMPGFDFVADHVGLREALTDADAVVTGEGRLDASSVTGKVPGALVSWATHEGIPVFVVAGDVDPSFADPRLADRVVITLTSLAGDLQAAMSDPLPYLREAGREVGRRLAGLEAKPEWRR